MSGRFDFGRRGCFRHDRLRSPDTGACPVASAGTRDVPETSFAQVLPRKFSVSFGGSCMQRASWLGLCPLYPKAAPDMRIRVVTSAR